MLSASEPHHIQLGSHLWDSVALGILGCGVLDLGIMNYGIGTYGFLGCGFLVFWLSAVCVYVVCDGVAVCKFEV